MIRTTCIKLSLLVLSAVLLAVPQGSANETPKPAATAAQKFYVHGGQSLRSWHLLGTYDSAEQACWAAMRFRDGDKFQAEVTTSPSDLWHSNAKEFRVYVNPCKFWALRGTVDTEEKARELAEKFKKEGNNVEIVYHFASK